MSGYGLIEQLTAVIKYLVDYPQGLSMLLGTVPPPSCEAIAEMLESARPVSEPTLDAAGMPLRVDGGDAEVLDADKLLDNEDRWNRVIEQAGGWVHIYTVVAEWREMFPKSWKVVADYVLWARLSPSRVDGPPLDRVAERNGMHRKTVSRIMQDFPQSLATAILHAEVTKDGALALSDSLDRAAV